MKNFKRIISFAMAMIICASFCLINGGAEWYDYTVGHVDIDSDYTAAYAEISITEWPQDTENTDLTAVTRAYLYGYIENLGERFDSFSVYVDLGIMLEDYSQYSEDSTVNWNGEDWIEAEAIGQNLLCGEPGYAIISLGSTHELTVYIYTKYNRDYGWYDSQPFQDGETVIFGMSY